MAQGALVYVMGASGAGKSRVIEEARRKVDSSLPVLFAHRYVTRVPGAGAGNDVALSTGEFALRLRYNLFVYDWEAYGLCYGIGIEIETWRRAGLAVVIDGSRAHFASITAQSGILPVLVTAPLDLRRARLKGRGRDDAAAIAARLERGKNFAPAHPDLVVIENAGALAAAGEALVKLLGRVTAAR